MRCKWPSTGLQFPLQCLQVESAVTPRERGGRSENAAALCISVEVRGRGNGCGSEWTRVVSAAVAARSSGHGDPARMLRKGRRTGARPAAQRRAGPGVGGKDGASRKAGRGAPASVRLHPAGTPLCRSILSTLVYHSATTPPLFIFTAPSPDPPCAHARPSPPHSSTPLCRALLTTVLLQPLPPRAPRLPGPRPSPQTGGEGRRDNPPALRSRAPSRVGVAWLRPGPQRLTSCLPTPWSVPQFSTRLSFPYEGTREQAWCPRSRRHPGRRELERSPGLQDSGLGETPSRPPPPHTVGEGEKGFWPGPLFAWFSPGTGFLPHPRCAVL